MAQVQITDLPQALALTGFESVPIVQNGVTVQTTTGAISAQPNLQYTFLTATQQAGLPNSRYLAVGSGLQIIDGGAQGTMQVNLIGAASSLNSSGNGIQVKTALGTLTARSITVGTGLSITNGDGVAGNPLIGLGSFLSNFQSMSGSTGLVGVKAGVVSSLAITGTSGNISVANGDGSTGNPTINLITTGATPGSYGSTTAIPVITVDSYGRITSVSTASAAAGGTVTSVAALTIGTSGTDLSSTVVNSTTTPVITLNVPTASATNRGALSSTDWTTFNNKQPAGTYVTAVTGTAPVVSSGGTTPIISMAAASASSNGYLTSTDWTTFNSKGAGTVTSVSGTTGRITSTGGATPIIDLASGIATAGTTGSSLLIPVVTIDTYGRVTSITTASNPQGTVTSVSGTGSVNGITLTGTVTSSGSLTLGGTLGGIGNSQLTNSSITINGSSVSLGGSITVTATASNALTIGTGLTGTSYNGSAPVTIAIDSTVATLTGTQTLTNKTISGASNTLSNIGNSSLTNSSVTIGSTSISLGSTSTSLAGISQITFAGAVSGTSTLQASPAAGSAISILPNVAGVLVNTGGTGVVSNTMLANSSITLGSTAVSLGATTSTLAGLTSVTVTQDPTTSLQLATKQYVDSVAQGLSTKAPVACATTANITLSGEQTIDGVTTSSSRVLVKNQGTSSQNGIYVSSSGAWTRSTDADTWNELISAYTWVQQGTINGDTGWVCTVDPGGTIGVTAVTWVQFAGSGSYTAGTGLTLTGTQFSLTSPVAASLGGTGVTTLTGLAYGNGTSAFTAATAAQVVSVIGTTAVTNATNAVNINITAATTGATNYLTFVTSTSGNLPQLVNSSITANAVNGTITGGIAGGAF